MVIRFLKCVAICLAFAMAMLSAFASFGNSQEQPRAGSGPLSFDELKVRGANRSIYRNAKLRTIDSKGEVPKPSLTEYRKAVHPILINFCVSFHGPDSQEGNLRVDSLNPDLLSGSDVDRWLEVFAVVSKGEMPPKDADSLGAKEQHTLIDWLSSELQTASTVRRLEKGRSSFRRMTRYEYRYALQDLFGLPYDFAKDLPPESASEDGFQNSSELLHMSTNQFETYRALGLAALKKATVQGQQPELIYWGVSMEAPAKEAWAVQEAELEKIKQQFKGDPESQERELERKKSEWKRRPHGAHYKNLETGRHARAFGDYNAAKFARRPQSQKLELPSKFEYSAVIPPKQKLIVELGDKIPDEWLHVEGQHLFENETEVSLQFRAALDDSRYASTWLFGVEIAGLSV